MTLPEQSDRAVAQTREFLVRLTSPYVEGGIKGIRKEIRAEASRMLRHYPYAWNDEKRGVDDMSVGWIPVAERLPDDGVWVLWFNKSWSCQLVVAKRDGESLDWGDDLCGTLHGFTHWMPLPEPPEVT